MTDPIILRAPRGWLSGLGLLISFSLSAAVVNDGTTTNNLVRFANLNGTGGAETSVSVASGSLVATQIGPDFGAGDFAVQTVWFAADTIPTGGVYTVSAGFQPTLVTSERLGGVMGWLNLNSSNGIVFQVVPEDSNVPKSFQVASVDFAAATAGENVTVNHLYNANGTPAVADFGSAWTDLGTSYTATNLATFQLEFTAPSTADLVAVSNATAHLKAKVFQGADASNNPVQVSATIELLTDLPLPPGAAHRFGYAAVWSSIFREGEAIGYLDDLSAAGEIGAPPNTPPTITIATPTNGATYSEPANITITADTTDSDGTVARVDFFQGTTLIGATTNSSYSLTWSNVAAGAYALTAVATDNLGAATTSAPVNITVTQSSGTGPSITVVQNGNFLDLSWATTGYQLQLKTNLSSLSWIDVPNTVNTNHATVAVVGGEMFFRLVQQGGSGGPTLTIQQTNNVFEISWATSGFQLQMKTDLLSSSWTDVPNTVNTNHATISITGGNQYFRLVQPGGPGGPALTIQSISNTDVAVSWPASVTGYRLQATTSLSSPAWADVASTNNRATETISGPTRFYRLINP